MKARGIEDVECVNLFDTQLQSKFDTILLLMNGTGIAGKLSRLPLLLNRLKELMAEGAQILIDSSDLKYIYENEDGSMDIDLGGNYYGEVDYQMVYKNVKGDSFDWLYVDPTLLTASCEHGREHTQMCRSSVLIVVADSTAHRIARRGDGCCVHCHSVRALRKEFGKYLHAVLVVNHASCFSATMHCKDSVAHVYTTQWDR